jgi:hypothetical protein
MTHPRWSATLMSLSRPRSVAMWAGPGKGASHGCCTIARYRCCHRSCPWIATPGTGRARRRRRAVGCGLRRDRILVRVGRRQPIAERARSGCRSAQAVMPSPPGDLGLCGSPASSDAGSLLRLEGRTTGSHQISSPEYRAARGLRRVGWPNKVRNPTEPRTSVPLVPSRGARVAAARNPC